MPSVCVYNPLRHNTERKTSVVTQERVCCQDRKEGRNKTGANKGQNEVALRSGGEQGLYSTVRILAECQLPSQIEFGKAYL